MNGFNVGDNFLFAYHSNPENSIPENTFKFGHGIRKDSTTGSIEEKIVRYKLLANLIMLVHFCF